MVPLKAPSSHFDSMDPSARWKPGTRLVQYEMWGEGIVTARPVTVLEDRSSHLALYSHPGARIASRGIKSRYSLGLSERIDLYIESLDPSVGDFEDRISSDTHVLTLTPPDSWHSVWLFWSAQWQFQTWYVNFQSPIRRLRGGIQFHDYVLDIVVAPDMSWSWKDLDEFEELIARRFFTGEQVASIRSEADRMVRRIERGGSPFCDGWENWRPDQRWSVPRLPNGWKRSLRYT